MSPAALVADALRGTDEIIAVTGATGWFGAVALDLLFTALGEDAPARVVGYASVAREVTVADGRTVVVRPLHELVSQDPPPTTILHLAYLTPDRIQALGVDAYTSQNVAITATVLDAIATHRPRHVLVTSSGAVYSSSGRLAADLRSDAYGTLKHIDELAFRTASRDAGAVCVIPRVFNVAGGRRSKPTLYALGSMIAMARDGGPIDVHARWPVYRSYCGVDEVVALSLWLALAGVDVVFDTSGEIVEIGDLALLLARLHGLDESAVRRIWDSASAEDRYVGDGRRMLELAARAGLRLRSLVELVTESSTSHNLPGMNQAAIDRTGRAR